MVEFIPLDLEIHRNEIVELNIEYMTWIFDQLRTLLDIDPESVVGNVPDYIQSKIGEIYAASPPEGLCYLIKVNDEFVGMGAFKKLRNSIAEIKRMYVKPEYRGQGLGKKLMLELISKIEEYGYSQIFLDSGPFMDVAKGLYRKMGFVEREVYPETEVPEDYRHLWTYMEKKLKRS